MIPFVLPAVFVKQEQFINGLLQGSTIVDNKYTGHREAIYNAGISKVWNGRSIVGEQNVIMGGSALQNYWVVSFLQSYILNTYQLQVGTTTQ